MVEKTHLVSHRRGNAIRRSRGNKLVAFLPVTSPTHAAPLHRQTFHTEIPQQYLSW